LVFAECPERFAIPEILEVTMGKIEIIGINRNYSDNSDYRDFFLLDFLGELDASLSRFLV
jgi:hypothetical protein